MKFNLKLDKTKRYVLAFSGGIDSTVLLKLLHDGGFIFRAIYVHHGINKEYSDEAEKFTREMAARFDVPYSCIYLKLSEKRRKQMGMEAHAREERYKVISEHLADDEILLTGQHMDDQFETIMFQIFRGCGVLGASGMETDFHSQIGTKWIHIMRPMLENNMDKTDMYHIAEVHDLQWIEDESNKDLKYSRNYLRHKVVPLVKEKFENVIACVRRFSHHLRITQNLLSDLARIDIKNISVSTDSGLIIDKGSEAFAELSDDRLKNAITFILRSYDVQFQESNVNELLKGFRAYNKKFEQQLGCVKFRYEPKFYYTSDSTQRIDKTKIIIEVTDDQLR
jgi:tRNA(Ile)-lysidine synthase